MVQPTDQPTMQHRVRNLEAKKYACGQSLIHWGGRTDKRYYKRVLTIDACGEALNKSLC